MVTAQSYTFRIVSFLFQGSSNRADNDRSTLISQSTTIRSASGQKRLPSLRMPPFFDILQLKPKHYNKREITVILERSNTTPFKSKKKKKCTCKKGTQEALFPDIEGGNVLGLDKSGQPPAFGDSKIENEPPVQKTASAMPHAATESPKPNSPGKLSIKAQSVPDLRFAAEETGVWKGRSESMDNVLNIRELKELEELPKVSLKESMANMENGKHNGSHGVLNPNIAEEVETEGLKDTSYEDGKKKMSKRSDKLDELTDKEFRRRLISQYSKQREDRNKKSFVESIHGEKHSLIKIKFSDIVNNAPKHISQNRILKRLRERAGLSDAEPKDELIEKEVDQITLPDKEDTLPKINPKGYPGFMGMTGEDIEFAPSKSIMFPSLANEKTDTSLFGSSIGDRSKAKRYNTGHFNVNNNNTGYGDMDSIETHLPAMVVKYGLSESIESLEGHESQTVVTSTPRLQTLPAIDELEVNSEFMELKANDSSTPIQPTRQKKQDIHKSRSDQCGIVGECGFNIADDDTLFVDSEEIHVSLQPKTPRHEDIGEGEFEGNILDCKYLRGYDPPQMRAVDDINEFVFDGKTEPQLRKMSFFHTGQFRPTDVIVEEEEEDDENNME